MAPPSLPDSMDRDVTEGKELGVWCFILYSSFLHHFTTTMYSRRLLFFLLAHTSLQTVGKSLKKYFFIIGNFKTIITLCVTNVQRKKIVGIF